MSFADLKKARTARQHPRAGSTLPSPSQSHDDVARDVASPLGELGLTKDSVHEPSPPSVPGPIPGSSVPSGEGIDDETKLFDAGVYGLPSELSVRTSKKRGRSVYAAKPLKAGTAILRVRPAVAVVSSSMLGEYCSNCGLSIAELAIAGQDVKTLKRCTSCRVTHYCSVKCQRDDWPGHKPECAAHKSLRTLSMRSSPGTDPDLHRRWVMSESLRALGRLCWARKAGRVDGRDPDWWPAVAALESHVKRLEDPEIMQLGTQIQRLRHYLSVGTGLLGEEPVPADMVDYGFKNSADLLHLVSAFAVNSFTLSTPSLSPIGVASSPPSSLFNHSCIPNCAVVFPSGAGQMQVVALRDIKAGEEVLMSYIDISLPKAERQADLLKRYGFTCDCPLCARSDEKVDARWCIRHSGCNSQGAAKMPDLAGPLEKHEARCKTCKESFTVNLRQLPRLIEVGKRMLKAEEEGSLGIQQLSQVLPALLHLTPPSAHPTFALLRLQALLLTPPASSADLQTCISSLALAYAGAEMIHPSNHPTLAVILAEWGKTLSIELEGVGKKDTLRRLMEAVVVLRKAFTTCEGGFGKGGGIVGKEVEGLIRGCEGEIGLLRSYAV